MFSSLSLESQKTKTYLKVKSVETDILREQPDLGVEVAHYRNRDCGSSLA